MSRFAYSAIKNGGQRVSGVLQSRNQAGAVNKLLQMGCHPVELQADNHAKNQVSLRALYNRVFHRITVSDLAVLTRQMASLLKAGLPVVQMLATLRQQCGHQGLIVVIEDLEIAITQDASTLTEAMERHPEVFDAVYCGLVHSGEESGNLVEVLQEMAGHLSRSAKLRGQVLGAFIYPIFLVILGTVAIFVLMTFVIPQFKDLFESFGQALPLPTQVLIRVSHFLSVWWWAVLAGALATTTCGLVAMRKSVVKKRIDVRILKIPVLGEMFLKLEVARVSRTLGALIGGGVRMINALLITGRTAKNLAIRETFKQISDKVATGSPLADAIHECGIYPPMVESLIRTGENTGELPEMLQELADIYENESERAVNGAVKLLEPTLIVIMGLIIAGIVAAVIMPIFQSNAMLGG